MGGEAQSPRFSMAHAANLVPFRVNFVFLSSVLLTTFLVPSNDARLLGGTGITSSPFILACQEAGIGVVPHVLNAGMMVSIMGNGAEAVYISSRVLRTMAHQDLISEWFAQVDSKGRPRRSLVITAVAAVVLTYINLTGMSEES